MGLDFKKVLWIYDSDMAFLAARFSLKASIAEPNTQYGMAKVRRKIINQNPIVSMVKNAKNPKYWSNSKIIANNFDTKIH